MKIYLDVVLFINFAFDFLLLLTVSILLKRKIKIFRLILSSLFGAISIVSLFLPLNSFTLFLFKIFISIIMILILFGKKNFIKNIAYLYFTSIILGGFLYFINLQFSYKNEGLIFFYNGFSINIIVLLIISPVILYFYIKSNRYSRDTLSNIYNVEIMINDKIYNYQGYLDTGNKLYEPYKHREVNILYDKDLLNRCDINYLIVPYNCVNYSGILKGFVADKMIIDNKYVILKPFIGLSDKKFNLDSSDIILHSSLKNNLN